MYLFVTLFTTSTQFVEECNAAEPAFRLELGGVGSL